MLTSDEFDLFFLLLTVAGNETTRNAAAGGMLALFEHPDQWQRLLADPALIPTAAEEIVRWVSPVNLFRRTALRDTELERPADRGGRQGGGVLRLRQPRRGRCSATPQRFDVGRDPTRTSGSAAAARISASAGTSPSLELRVLLQALAERMPQIASTGRPSRLRSNFINGIKHMPVRFTPSVPRT